VKRKKKPGLYVNGDDDGERGRGDGKSGTKAETHYSRPRTPIPLDRSFPFRDNSLFH
jgi:hypothetical protein